VKLGNQLLCPVRQVRLQLLYRSTLLSISLCPKLALPLTPSFRWLSSALDRPTDQPFL